MSNMRQVCDECQEPMRCIEAGACFIQGIATKHGANMSPEISGFNTNWSGLNPDEYDIDKTFGNKEWLDRNGFDVVN